jgi:cell division protein FtsQ
MIGLSVAVLVLLAGLFALVIAVHNFLDHDPRFRIDTASSIQTFGNSQLTRADLLSVFGSDIGRNLFFVPLTDRRAALEQIPWVEHAIVMRLLPNQLRVAVIERTPIAFVRVGNKIDLVDKDGVILEMPPTMMSAKHYSFPVVTGIEPGDPLSTRHPRMRMYQRFISELDAGGEKISEQLSEVDLSDTEDVRATVPAKGSDILLHFGEDDFLNRYHNYQSHLAEWQQQYPHLASVDLRYERQVVLKMADNAPTDATQTPDASAATQPPAPVKHVAPVKHPATKAHAVAHAWKKPVGKVKR